MINWLKRAWKDVLRGDNIDQYACLIAAMVLAVVTIFWDPDTSTWLGKAIVPVSLGVLGATYM